MKLSALEKWLLAIPLAGGVVFGLAPLVVPAQFAAATGYTGQDPYVYRIAGAATFGYAVALWLGIRRGDFAALRAVIAATLAFNIVSIIASGLEILAGRAQPVVYLIVVTDIAIISLTARILMAHAGQTGDPRRIPQWIVVVTALATVAAAVFGILPQFPTLAASLSGATGKDEFIFRQAGASTFGYAVMGVLELRSLRWSEIRFPAVMGATFNGLSFLASLYSIASGFATPVVLLIAGASGLFTVLIAAQLVRDGR
jgi:hypothetical protein